MQLQCAQAGAQSSNSTPSDLANDFACVQRSPRAPIGCGSLCEDAMVGGHSVLLAGAMGSVHGALRDHVAAGA